MCFTGCKEVGQSERRDGNMSGCKVTGIHHLLKSVVPFPKKVYLFSCASDSGYLITTPTNQNCTVENNGNILNSSDACYHLA